ncbi:MAG: hypothetical protein K8S94_02485 [Planctomycetia bacterium]|nr:hypothetical protein [Planctomycetia bacterium]
MRPCLCSLPIRGIAAALAAVAMLCGGTVSRAANQPTVIAVVACDGYADLRDQLSWVGEQVGNPTLAGFAESFLLLATQGKGLAGLDVKRPIGVIVTTEGGPLPSAHAFVPVKDLGKLLEALKGMTGPVEKVDGVLRIAPPGAPPVEISERNGWAIISQEGATAGIDDPLPLIGPVVKDYSLGVELFPSRMPDEMRQRLKGLLDEAAQNAAAQGQAMDAAPLAAAIDNLDDVEQLLFGFAVDKEKNRMLLDVTTVMTPGSAAADVWTEAAKTAATVGSPATSDGKPAAVRGHYAQAVPASARAVIEAGILGALAAGGSDPVASTLAGLASDIVTAMLETGSVDAGMTLDTSAADEQHPLPALTVGMRIKDGAALEKQVKVRLGAKDRLPANVSVKFDAGKQGDARLHEVTVDVSGTPAAKQLGDTVTLTLAVLPEYAYLLAGDNVPQRLAAAIGAGGKPLPDSKPITGVELSLASLIGYAAKMTKAFNPEDPQGEMLGEVAEQAAAKDATQVRFSLQPVTRGVTLRLSADAGAIQTIAASAAVQQAAPPPMQRPRPRAERAPADGGPALVP